MSYCIIHKTTYHIAFYFLLIFNLHVTVLWFLLLNILNQNIVMCNDCRPGGGWEKYKKNIKKYKCIRVSEC